MGVRKIPTREAGNHISSQRILANLPTPNISILRDISRRGNLEHKGILVKVFYLTSFNFVLKIQSLTYIIYTVYIYSFRFVEPVF